MKFRHCFAGAGRKMGEQSLVDHVREGEGSGGGGANERSIEEQKDRDREKAREG